MSPYFEEYAQQKETVLLGESDEIYEIHLFFKRRSKRRRREESGKEGGWDGKRAEEGDWGRRQMEEIYKLTSSVHLFHSLHTVFPLHS